MKCQYLGDSRDSFKWDYHHYLVPALGAKELQIVWMMTQDDNGSHGQSAAERFPARPEILDFCNKLSVRRDARELAKLPTTTCATYDVQLVGSDETFTRAGRAAYFDRVTPSNGVIFLDPDNGFAPEKSCSEKHIGYADIDGLVQRMPTGAVISVFHYFRRKCFPEDFARIRERLLSGIATAIYWHAVMFVSVTNSVAMRNRVREANRAYAAARRVVKVLD